jgi:hypothetical protein
MVFGCNGRQSLRQQEVESVPLLHFDNVALTAEVFDIVNQQQFAATVVSFGESFVGSFDGATGRFRLRHLSLWGSIDGTHQGSVQITQIS